MTLQMKDKSQASQRWVKDAHGNGRCKLTFHGLQNYTLTLPVGLVPTLGMVERLYAALSATVKQ